MNERYRKSEITKALFRLLLATLFLEYKRSRADKASKTDNVIISAL